MNNDQNGSEQFDELLRITEFYYAEAERCRKTKAYLAGCIMLGAALEAALLAMVECYPEEIQGSVKVQTRSGARRPLSEWTLAELLDIAKEMKWLPASLAHDEEFDADKAHVGDYAEVVRQIRNLVHPGRYITDYPSIDIGKEHLDLSFDVLQATFDWLHAKLIDSLRQLPDLPTKKPRRRSPF